MKKAILPLSFTICYLILFSFGLRAQEVKVLKAVQDSTEQSCFITDGHTHDLIPGNELNPAQSELSKFSKQGIKGVILVFPLNQTNSDKVLKQIKMDIGYVQACAKEKGIEISFVKGFLVNCCEKQFNTVQVLPSVEYFDGLFNGSIERLKELKEYCIRSVTLVNNRKDAISSDRNLSDRIISELTKNGVKEHEKQKRTGLSRILNQERNSC